MRSIPYYIKLFLNIFFLFLVANSCTLKENKKKIESKGNKKLKAPLRANSTNKHKVIVLLPLGNVSKGLTENLYGQIKGYFHSLKLLPKEPLPDFAYYPPRNRYRADKLIQWMNSRAKANEVYVGITTSDISATKNGVYDWGLMGLGYRPGNACVASNRRIKNKANFYKIIIHEIGHTTGLDHCPVKSCYMRDAEGKDHTSEVYEFCTNCKKVLKGDGWVF